MVGETISQHLYQLEQQAQACAWSLPSFQATLAQPTTQLFTHYQHQQLVAYLLVQDQVDVLEILQLTVLPTHRRQGIAKALLQSLVSYAYANNHIERVILDVRASNQAAISLYQQQGYAVDGVRRAYYPAGNGMREDAVLMSLAIVH